MSKASRYSWLFLAAAILAGSPALAQEDQFPPGPGRDIVLNNCGVCHELTRVTRSGYTPENWHTVLAMMGNLGLSLPEDQLKTVTAYLIKNFPERQKPASKRIGGPVQVSFKEWVVPTPGSRPHDPLATPDGAIWWTGQYANVLGRLDPKTGEMKEYKLPIAQSGPHGLTNDKDGNIWYAANFKGYVGKLDPKTGKVTVYRTNNPKARDPHTPLFDHDGILWFTLQQSNMIGRLDPKTGDMKLVTLPTPRSAPYGMVINSKGIPFFDLFGTNKLASIDPKTLKVTEYPLPVTTSRPRRIAITSDDVLWYGDYSMGYLGRLDPKTGAVREWASPGGPKSLPYGITALNDEIWYVEGGTSPNTLVRFDPKTQKFETWPIPSGGGVVRNMMPTADGNLVLAESGVNRVALVTITR